MPGRDERPEWLKRLYQRSERLGGGFYRTPKGQLLINITEILDGCGLEDTEENREIARDEVRAQVRARFGANLEVYLGPRAGASPLGGPPPRPPGI